MKVMHWIILVSFPNKLISDSKNINSSLSQENVVKIMKEKDDEINKANQGI